MGARTFFAFFKEIIWKLLFFGFLGFSMYSIFQGYFGHFRLNSSESFKIIQINPRKTANSRKCLKNEDCDKIDLIWFKTLGATLISRNPKRTDSYPHRKPNFRLFVLLTCTCDIDYSQQHTTNAH